MDKANELYYLNKYKYLNLTPESSTKSPEELSKEEKKRQKELKKKQMQELCQQKNKKVMNLSKEKTIIDETKPGEKKIYQNFRKTTSHPLLKVHGMPGGKRKAFLKLI